MRPQPIILPLSLVLLLGACSSAGPSDAVSSNTSNISDTTIAPPRITSPVSGSTITTSTFSLEGTCTPGTVFVSGAPSSVQGPCTNGAFSLSIDVSSVPNGHQAVKLSAKIKSATGSDSDATSAIYNKEVSGDPFVAQWSGFVFSHPGLWSSAKDLKYIISAVANGTQPQANQFSTPAATPPAYTPHPTAHPGSGILDKNGETWNNQLADANQAYIDALTGALSGNLAYAHAAENILDAWVTGGGNPKNAFQGEIGADWYLGTGWIAAIWANAAELARSSDPAWPGAEAFGEMLNRYVLPVLHIVVGYGNRQLAVINGLMAAGVYNNDPAAFAEGITDFDNMVKAYYFMEGDTPNHQPLPMNYFLPSLKPTDAELLAVDGISTPIAQCGIAGQNCETANEWPSYIYYAQSVANMGDDRKDLEKYLDNPAGLWIDDYQDNKNCGLTPTTFKSGYTLETCRDLGHTSMSLGLTFNALQMAWNQGIDLFKPNEARLTTAMELLAGWGLGISTAPLTVVGGTSAGFENAFNHYHWIEGIELPNSEKLIAINRAAPQLDGASAYQNYDGEPVICVYTAPAQHGPLPGQLQAPLLSGPNEFCGIRVNTKYLSTASSTNIPFDILPGTPTSSDQPRSFISSDYPATAGAGSTGAIPIEVSFNRSVTGLTLQGINVINGTASNLKPVSCPPNTNAMSCHTLDVTPNAPGGVAQTGVVSVNVSAGAAVGTTGLANVNSEQLNFISLYAAGTMAQKLSNGSEYINILPALIFGDLNKENANYP